MAREDQADVTACKKGGLHPAGLAVHFQVEVQKLCQQRVAFTQSVISVCYKKVELEYHFENQANLETFGGTEV